jgi:hypothetical protein
VVPLTRVLRAPASTLLDTVIRESGGARRWRQRSDGAHKRSWRGLGQIITQRASYYISREGPGEKAMADDEAELEIVATIDAITSLQRKHLGQEMVISLPAAENAPRQVDDGQC